MHRLSVDRCNTRSMDGSLDGADDMGQFDHRQATYRLPQAYTKVEGGPQVNAGLTSSST